MSPRRERIRVWRVAGLGALGACLLAVPALAYVEVYSNNFGNRLSYREIETVTKTNKCKRAFKEARDVMEITAADGPLNCKYKPPVQGSAPRPDHRFDANGRILRKTPDQIRSDAFLAVSVRVGGGNRYELRVYPRDHDYELRRQPGGPMFPSAGSNTDIEGIGKLNKIRLQVDGSRVRAFANGSLLADITDPNSSEVKGAKVEFGLGNVRDTGKATVGTFDKLKLSVPTP
ncbi:MAG: hypothetical protein ACR2G3_02175 [Solirubrobacterales bacterium]